MSQQEARHWPWYTHLDPSQLAMMSKYNYLEANQIGGQQFEGPGQTLEQAWEQVE